MRISAKTTKRFHREPGGDFYGNRRLPPMLEADTASIVSEFPYKSIVDAANRSGCDLIFMASHGLGGIACLLLSLASETEKALVNSKIPVLACR